MLALEFTIFPNIKTERLLLRQLNEDDTTSIYFLRSNKNVLRHISKEPAKDRNEALEFIKRVNLESNTGQTILWGITLREKPESVIGTICFWNISKENHRAELGYTLHPDYWRKGIMREAILRILNYGFDVLKLHSIEARTAPENIPSAALLESVGFVKEGHLKEVIYFCERFYDSLIYSKFKG